MGFFSFVQSFFKSSDKARQTDVPDADQAPNIPDAEESFEMDSDAGHIMSIADLPLKSDSSVLDSRWPPFPRAVQVLSPKHLINAQAELVRNLCSAIPLSDDEVERYLMPVVWNGPIVGAVIAYSTGAFWSALALSAVQIAAEEAVVMYVIGLPLLKLLPRSAAFRRAAESLG